MPQSNFWIALEVKIKKGEEDAPRHHRAFDENKAALAWVRSHRSMVLLGGGTLELAAEKAFGRVPSGTVIPALLVHPRHRGLPRQVTVPTHGPVTIEAKREQRKAKKLEKSAIAAVAAAAAATATPGAAAASNDDASNSAAASGVAADGAAITDWTSGFDGAADPDAIDGTAVKPSAKKSKRRKSDRDASAVDDGEEALAHNDSGCAVDADAVLADNCDVAPPAASGKKSKRRKSSHVAEAEAAAVAAVVPDEAVAVQFDVDAEPSVTASSAKKTSKSRRLQ